MSRENVEIVRQLQPPSDADLTDFFARGDEEAASALLAAAAQQFTSDFVCVFHGVSSEPRPGVEGLREAWLDWLEPWETYRAEIQEVRDCGDKVLVLSRDYGRRSGMADEVPLVASAVWTVRDGKVCRAEFFADRAQALAAVGLRDEAGASPDVAAIAEAAYSAIDRRDLDAFLAAIHPEAEFRSLIAEMEGRTYTGHEGVREWWDSVASSMGGLRFEREEIETFRNRGVTRLRVVASLGEGEVPTVMWHAWRVEDGLVRWWSVYRTEREALEAVGLGE